MQEIFDLKAILLQENRQKDFRLYHEICQIIAEDLQDNFFIYNQNPKKALNLNKKDGFLSTLLSEIKMTEVKFFETDLSKIDEKFPLILAPLCLHKANDIKEKLQYIKNLLEEKGIFVGTFFGLSNLESLGHLLSEEDIKICGQPLQRMLPLIDIKTIGMMLASAGFKNPVVYTLPISFEFENLQDALAFLKDSGEGNVLKLREKSLISGTVLKKYIAKYQKSITLRFEICFFSCHL